MKANLASTSGIEQLVGDIKNEGLEPNIFVNNAAAPINAASLKDLCWSDIIGHLETQSKVLLQVVQSMTPTFEKQRFGRVVSISSAVSERAVTENWLGYTVNKAVVEKISRQIAIEMGYLGVTSNCIAPGMCETAYIGDISEKIQKIAAHQSPNRRLALPEDVSNLAAFLTSDQASHINGQVLHVNGGANV